ncbi:uncharacterized protein LOC127857963 isoform X3 [Dreissena polymorpha]|uniref:uncharacterized protein LOC127857963 isoform X3 n=1 Tax=Dreissena polymorpha TaxID=45954 RepID=UPI002265038D|nr:uncharacterized protein LOC127857963 isoform X3 [Dreissena polymorpha]
MSNWNNPQQPVPGQVQFFDPTKFQSAVPASQPNVGHNAAPQHQANSQADGQGGWTSWGAWDPGANPYASDFNAAGAAVDKDNVGPVQHSVLDQQQWYGQDQWNQSQGDGGNVIEQNGYIWDQNSGQWLPKQQEGDPNQYGMYNHYWAGQNGYEGYEFQGNSQNSAQPANVSNGEFISQGEQANFVQSQNPEFTGTNNGFSYGVEKVHQNIQDVSQSTEESQSTDRSLGNVEGGEEDGVDDEYEEESDETDEYSEDSDVVEDDSNLNSISNASTGAIFETENEGYKGGSSGFDVQMSNEGIPLPTHSGNHVQVGTELAYQMQTLNMQEDSVQNSQMIGVFAEPNQYASAVPMFQPTIEASNVPLYVQQTESFNYSHDIGANANTNINLPTGIVQAIQQVSISQDREAERSDDHSDPPSKATTTPTFSDWEMVPGNIGESQHPPPVLQQQSTHSRNVSLDNNAPVKFFISSTNSSARVSPASASKVGDDLEHNVQEAVDKLHKAVPSVPEKDHSVQTFSSTLPETPKPPVQAVAPPPVPPISGPSVGANPFRKNKTDLPKGKSSEDVSLLSSTQLDMTRPNFENSPVVLGSTISPILRTNGNQNNNDDESPEFQLSTKTKDASDTPNSRKSGSTVPESPIMPRKESAFRPPNQDPKSKPMKASHDIAGFSEQQQSNEVSKQVNLARKDGEESKIMERKNRGNDRKTPEWEWNERKNDRRTPDRDMGNKKYDRRTPDRDTGRSEKGNEERERGYIDRDRDYGNKERDRGRYPEDKLASRPPAGSNVGDRRQRQSAFHHIQTHRSRNSVSPAASLLDVADNVPAVSNILLAPARGLVENTDKSLSSVTGPSELNPVVSLISSMSEQIQAIDKDEKGKRVSKSRDDLERDRDRDDRYKERDISDRDRLRDNRDRNDSRDLDRPRKGDRDNEREGLHGNRSYDNLRDRNLKDSRYNSREQLSIYGSRNSLDGDESRDRSRRGNSRDRDRDRSYRDEYYDRYRDRDRDRPPSRSSVLDGSRRDYRGDRDRDYYRRERPDRDRTDRDRPDRDRTDRDRPRSRQGDRDRPVSRIADSERPKSRGDYEREYRDKYRDKEPGTNTSGFDYEDYYRRGGQYYDRQYYDYYYGTYGQPGGGYYDEYGYYRTDIGPPRYPDPYQMRARTGTPGSLSEGGQEIASLAEKNKSSADKSDSKKRFEYPPELYDYSRTGYEDYHGYEYNGYRWDPDVSAWVETTTDVIPQRQTPEKFMIPHRRAAFGPNGQLVSVLPSRPADGEPATVEIHNVQAMLEVNQESQELADFPGPLVRGDTHKNDVLLYCQSKARACAENMALEDRDSAELIWRFLELLIKQNGTLVGTDIADLLLQGHEPTTQDYRKTGMQITPSSDHLEADEAESDVSDPQRLSRGTTPVDRVLVNKGRSLEECTDRFRHLLMYGRKKDALDWAMKNNLWGHALFLASKMDPRAHASVMLRFANVAMRMNDPLQTLYQLMSGRQPAAVTCVTEERWGDWRPHLAMILSNQTTKTELDRKSITTLGDTLASRGFLHASHFCYLMSRVGFGTYARKSSKIVLIGSSHGLPLELFANNEAIQCTEIYEYALALGNVLMALISFQTYKYLYATRLANYGYAQEALQYCEVIARQINTSPAYFPHTLVKLIFDLSSQLKFSDPRMEEEEDVQDPEWLRALHATLVQFEEGAIQPQSGAATPAYFGGRTTASSESGEVGMYMQAGEHAIPQEATYVGNTMVGAYTQDPQYAHGAYEAQAYQTTEGQYIQHYDPSQAYPADGQTGETTGYVMQGADNQHQYQQGIYGQTQWQEQPEVTNENQAQTEAANQNTAGFDQTAGHFQPYVPNQNANHWSHSQNKLTGFPQDVNLGESQNSAITSQSNQSEKRSSIASNSSISQEEHEDTVDAQNPGNFYSHQPSIFDLQPAQTRIIAPKLRPRTISESSNGSGGGGRDRHPSGGRNLNQSKSKPDSYSGKESLGGGKQKPAAAAGGGLFAKIGGLFSRKNEMKLPDDKEPAIVWDPVKKRWVDKNGDDKEETPTAPPPKDHELPGTGMPPQPTGIPTMEGPMTSNQGNSDFPPSGPNKFSRKNAKGFGARKQYVDVLNPNSTGGHSVPSGLFSTLPSSHSAPAIFNPMGFSDGGSDTSQSQEADDSGSRGDNPSQAQTASSMLPPLQENVSSEATPANQSASGMPAMFDPTQFQSNNQGFKQPAPPPSQGRLSNRRVYPKR